MKFLSLFALSLILVLGRVPAQAQSLTGVEILEYGAMMIGEDLGESSPPNEGFRHHAVSGAKLKQTTRKIIGRLGNSFGIRFRYHGEMIGDLVPVTVRLVFPPPGLRSPEGTRTLRYDDVHGYAAVGIDDFRSMTFDYSWEIIPGIWHFQVWSEGKKLADEAFEVILPPTS